MHKVSLGLYESPVENMRSPLGMLEGLLRCIAVERGQRALPPPSRVDRAPADGPGSRVDPSAYHLWESAGMSSRVCEKPDMEVDRLSCERIQGRSGLHGRPGSSR